MNYIIRLFYNWYRNAMKRPLSRRLIILGTIIYLLSPIDISPDLIPILGWIDDGLLITLLVSELSILFWGYSQKSHTYPTVDNNSSQVTTIDVEVIQ
ncbi:YkvA family protein [Cyanobacterium sp. uoEpiScrs1]|uniref:YkvA family protein n=1 Tax=Cyanobacterium sp. uoEpiScrs1 TaxID=2976343 RepID=UPI002269FAD1|nr:YkvA family protein [Cyanobacterium sp. uoEpiScrs1]